MSMDRPDLPYSGRTSDGPQVDEDLREEGVEVDDDGNLQGLDRPGGPSEGPQPPLPRRPADEPPADS